MQPTLLVTLSKEKVIPPEEFLDVPTFFIELVPNTNRSSLKGFICTILNAGFRVPPPAAEVQVYGSLGAECRIVALDVRSPPTQRWF